MSTGRRAGQTSGGLRRWPTGADCVHGRESRTNRWWTATLANRSGLCPREGEPDKRAVDCDAGQQERTVSTGRRAGQTGGGLRRWPTGADCVHGRESRTNGWWTVTLANRSGLCPREGEPDKQAVDCDAGQQERTVSMGGRAGQTGGGLRCWPTGADCVHGTGRRAGQTGGGLRCWPTGAAPGGACTDSSCSHSVKAFRVSLCRMAY